MDVSQFSFDLPDELVAQEPPPERGGSRLMVLHRHDGRIQHSRFSSLSEHLQSGDLLVLNNSRVFPARLLGVRLPGGGAVECLLVRRESADTWDTLMHPGQRLKEGSRVRFDRDGLTLHGEVIARRFFGRRSVRLGTESGLDVDSAIDRIGHIPLPPYIKRPDQPSDRDRYQTVYAREKGSIAAPTAGLHFTPEVLAKLAARGIEQAEITLHVGYGTFKPIRVERIEDHSVDAEAFEVSQEAAGAITRARKEGRRVIAVGTTTTRVLESLSISDEGDIVPAHGETSLYIRPGHPFRIVDGLITNFHLPQSSLLILVAAFAGREQILTAYREAVAHRYRFYSYGDAMLIL
jgi:S-adenosylmethionine:tRNA ribosyltransferase-isomerase